MIEFDIATVYFDPATIRRDGWMRRAWELKDLKQRAQFGAMSFKSYDEYDCKERRRRALQLIAHDGPMASGKLIVINNQPSDWSYVAPNTTGELMLDIVCAR